jgi:hypothetical protein
MEAEVGLEPVAVAVTEGPVEQPTQQILCEGGGDCGACGVISGDWLAATEVRNVAAPWFSPKAQLPGG